ncbi:MAG: universal stress protein [Gemmatimonadota bacterium]
MKTIMVPLDGSELAERALDPALRLAARHEATVLLAAIVSDLPPVPLASLGREASRKWFEDEEKRAADYLEGVRVSAASRHPGVEIRMQVEMGSVARGLRAVAADAGVELVALTTHGRGAWKRAWLGSVADNLVRGARRPLLLLRHGDESVRLFMDEGSPTHVLVPLDSSSQSEAVLGPLTSLLGNRGRVTLITVVEDPFPLASSYLPHAIEGEAVAERQREQAAEHLRQVADQWNPLGVEVETKVVSGNDVAGTILDYSEKEGVDLLAFSTRGRGGVERLVLGSIADKLVRGSHLPMLTVRRGGEEN